MTEPDVPQQRAPIWPKVLVVPWIAYWLLMSYVSGMAVEGCIDKACQTTLTSAWAIMMAAQVVNAIGVRLLRNRWIVLLTNGIVTPPVLMLIYGSIVERML